MNGLFLKPFRLPFSNQETANRNAAMAKGPLQAPEPWQQSLVLFQVCRVIQDLLCWGEQPHSNPLPEGWAAAYRKSIANAVDLAKSNFHEDEETVEFLRKAERLATDVVSAMASSFSISGKVAAEWPEGYAERFQRLVKVELRLRELQESFAAAERQNDRLRREKRGFTRWASEVLANLPLMNPRTLNPRQVANLRQWVGLFVQHSGRPDDDLSTAELNAVMELSRSLQPFVVRAAQAIGFGDWGRLFAADYQSRSGAWEEFAAAVENPRRPAETQTADSSPVAIAAPQDRSAAFTAAVSRQVVDAAAVEPATGDQTQVNAKQLAGHAGVSDRVIRKHLTSCQQARTDTDGEKWWRYCDVVGQLRNWGANHRQDRLKNLVWPDLAKQLKNTTPGSKKK